MNCDVFPSEAEYLYSYNEEWNQSLCFWWDGHSLQRLVWLWAAEDCWLLTQLTCCRSGGGRGRDEWIRAQPHCSGNENNIFAHWYPNTRLFLSLFILLCELLRHTNSEVKLLYDELQSHLTGWTFLVNTRGCRMSHRTLETILQEEKRKGFNVKNKQTDFLKQIFGIKLEINEELTQDYKLRKYLFYHWNLNCKSYKDKPENTFPLKEYHSFGFFLVWKFWQIVIK